MISELLFSERFLQLAEQVSFTSTLNSVNTDNCRFGNGLALGDCDWLQLWIRFWPWHAARSVLAVAGHRVNLPRRLRRM
jgi:hypothetical protein